MIEPSDLETLMKPIFNINSIKKAQLLANGIGIKSGVACGRIVFDSNEAKLQDKDTILVKNEITGRDIDGLIHSCGILTKSCASNMLGGTRKFNQCAVVGGSALEIDEKNETLKINGLTLTKNDYISIDGNSGAIYKGKVELSSNEKGITLLKDILKLASKYETIQVRANCTTEEAIKKAYEYGAEGIDLVESEQILKNEECISNMIKIILSKEDRVINDALKKIEDYQEEYFYKVLKTMSAHPVNLKYLDTSLQQFLFKNESILESICNRLNLRIEETKNKINRSMSTNTITKYRNEMSVGLVQLRALIKGAIKVKKEGGEPTFEIRVPLPIRLEEFQSIKSIIEDNIKEITKQEDLKINYKVGVELRTPRDIMLSADISKCADFYSYDIGNLTKLTLGLSEGDIYREESIRSIHKNGVGELIKFAKKNAKKNIEMGVHSGQDYNDSAIRFCQKAGLNYFSCSLDKVPMMRLISAQCSNDEK